MKLKVNDVVSNLPEMAFVIFSIRLAVLGASIGDALALISVVAYLGYKHWIEKSKVEYTDEIKQKLEELEKSVTALKIGKVVNNNNLKGQQNEQKVKRFF